MDYVKDLEEFDKFLKFTETEKAFKKWRIKVMREAFLEYLLWREQE